MNKTQSIIFVIAVLALTIAGNWLYLNKPKKVNKYIPLKVEYHLLNHDVRDMSLISGRLNLHTGIKINDLLELKYINDTLCLCGINLFKLDSNATICKVVEYKE